jgi:cation diffusion facilitator family transporter
VARTTGGSEKTTVLVALGANGAIAVAKCVAGVLTGSSAILAEAAHSIADTFNQGLMLISLERSEKRPDAEHPFGYGKERFFWVLLAAVFIFVSGGVFSIVEGLYRALFGESGGKESWLIAYAVLVFALVAEGISLVRAVRQSRARAAEAELPFFAFLRQSKEPTVKTVVAEDAAAVVGVVIALAGTAAHQLTGSVVWDGVAAVLIGILLCLVGWALGRNTMGLLIGAPARPDERERLRRAILEHEGVDEVLELLTMYTGPHSVLVAVRLDFADGLSSSDVERISGEIEQRLHDELEDVDEVFLDATRARRSSSRAPASAAG